MTSDPEHWIEYAFPLAGFLLDEEPVFVSGILIARPTLEEWRLLEKTDVADLIVFPGLAGIAGAEPPICIYVNQPLSAEPDLEDVVEHWSDASGAADDVLYALWLHGDGDLPPPEMTCLYSNTSTGLYSRFPGPYRQGVRTPPGDPYRLRKADVQPVALLTDVLRGYRTGATDPAGEIALVNLRQSYGWYLAPADRLAMLFAALEALLGGYRPSREFGGLSMPRRAALALERPAVEEFLAGPGRALRNAVAHGTAPADAAAVDEVREIVRGVIARYVRFCVEQGPSSRPTDAFNEALADM